MGIQRIESVIYSVDDLATCVRFFTDLGLSPVAEDDERAVLTAAADLEERRKALDERERAVPAAREIAEPSPPSRPW